MEDPNITMGEYIRLKEEKACRHVIIFNDALISELGGARRSMTSRKFILALGLHTAEEMAEDGFSTYCMDQGEANVPYLLAQYLFRHAKGRKSNDRLLGGHFIGHHAHHFGLVSDEGLRGLSVVTREIPLIDMGELVNLNICMGLGDDWAWVALGPERQQVAAASTLEAAQGALHVDEGDPSVLAPVHAPPTTTVNYRSWYDDLDLFMNDRNKTGIIMEYVVKISKKARILELKRDKRPLPDFEEYAAVQIFDCKDAVSRQVESYHVSCGVKKGKSLLSKWRMVYNVVSDDDDTVANDNKVYVSDHVVKDKKKSIKRATKGKTIAGCDKVFSGVVADADNYVESDDVSCDAKESKTLSSKGRRVFKVVSGDDDLIADDNKVINVTVGNECDKEYEDVPKNRTPSLRQRKIVNRFGC
ncbi:hypothetical protein Tco_0002334 [Tanacetum coccineum]